MAIGLSKRDVIRLVNLYIGVSGGYLGDFSYRTHEEFYPEYCNLDINPNKYEGTTRERFIMILESSSPEDQAKIIRGILDKYPFFDEQKPKTRTQELYDEFIEIACKLEKTLPIITPNLAITSEIVERAINDAEILIQNNDAISGIDRIHTALHGYLKAVCNKEQICYDKTDNMAKLLKSIRRNYSGLQNLGSRSQNIEDIFQIFPKILNSLDYVRNEASVAHPNNELLGKDEAILVINITRTLLHYFNAKFK